MKITQNKNQKN